MFCDDIKVVLGLPICKLLQYSPTFRLKVRGQLYLNRIQHLDNTRMPQRSRFAHRILRKREARLVCIDIKCKDTASRTVILYVPQHRQPLKLFRMEKEPKKPPYPFRTVVQCPDRITDVDSVAEGKRESSTLRDGGSDG